jgi:hypothetical protein
MSDRSAHLGRGGGHQLRVVGRADLAVEAGQAAQPRGQLPRVIRHQLRADGPQHRRRLRGALHQEKMHAQLIGGTQHT